MYEYKVTKIIEVVDGDTVDVEISLGFGLKASLRIRVDGVDTYEIYGTNADPIRGPKAQEFTEVWLSARLDDLVVRTRKTSHRTVGIGDGAFGRWAGAFISPSWPNSLAEDLKVYGHVKGSE